MHKMREDEPKRDLFELPNFWRLYVKRQESKIEKLTASLAEARAEVERLREALATVATGVGNVHTDTLAVGLLQGVARAALEAKS